LGKKRNNKKGRTNFGIISTLKMLFWNHEYDSVIVQAGGIAETIFSGNSLRSPSDARHLDASGRTPEQLAGDAQRAEAIVQEHWQEILDLADVLEEKGLLIFWKNP
jgi:hypothetical protein